MGMSQAPDSAATAGDLISREAAIASIMNAVDDNHSIRRALVALNALPAAPEAGEVERLRKERDYDRRQSEHKSSVIDRLNGQISTLQDRLSEAEAALSAQGEPVAQEPRTDGPDRIWAWAGDEQDGWENAYATVSHVSKEQVEYIRADLAHPAPASAGVKVKLMIGDLLDCWDMWDNDELKEQVSRILAALSQPAQGGEGGVV